MTNTGRPREWDAATYDALPLPHEQWGHRLLATQDLRGDEQVVDVGAGTGHVSGGGAPANVGAIPNA